MQIRLLSSRSSASQATGHPFHLLEDLSAALREHGHRVRVDLLGDTLRGQELTSLQEGATAGRKIAAGDTDAGCVLHALDTVAWAAALTARSLIDVNVVLRFSEPALGSGRRGSPIQGTADPGSGALGSGALGSGALGSGALGAGSHGPAGRGSGRVSTIGSATERRAYRACLRAADAIAATEDGDRMAAVRAGVPDNRALVVPDVVGLPPADSGPAPLQPGGTVLSLGGIGPGSGIDGVLGALRWLPDRELVVIGPGSGSDLDALRRRLERLELTDRVRWQGPVDRVAAIQLIDAAALVLLPDPAAGTRDAIVAMNRSRAVVTIDDSPAAGAVVDGVTGAVVPSGHPDLLGQTLRRLLSNPFRLAGMGLAGRERALARYARSRAVSATEQAYRVALGAA
jgi:glycosyl transferase family 1